MMIERCCSSSSSSSHRQQHDNNQWMMYQRRHHTEQLQQQQQQPFVQHHPPSRRRPLVTLGRRDSYYYYYYNTYIAPSNDKYYYYYWKKNYNYIHRTIRSIVTTQPNNDDTLTTTTTTTTSATTTTTTTNPTCSTIFKKYYPYLLRKQIIQRQRMKVLDLYHLYFIVIVFLITVLFRHNMNQLVFVTAATFQNIIKENTLLQQQQRYSSCFQQQHDDSIHRQYPHCHLLPTPTTPTTATTTTMQLLLPPFHRRRRRRHDRIRIYTSSMPSISTTTTTTFTMNDHDDSNNSTSTSCTTTIPHSITPIRENSIHLDTNVDDIPFQTITNDKSLTTVILSPEMATVVPSSSSSSSSIPSSEQQQQLVQQHLTTAVIPFYANIGNKQYDNKNNIKNNNKSIFPNVIQQLPEKQEHDTFVVQQPTVLKEHQPVDQKYRPRFYTLLLHWLQSKFRRRRRSNVRTNTMYDNRPPKTTIRSLWRHRHARSFEEGIRREYVTANTFMTTTENDTATTTTSILTQPQTQQRLDDRISTNNNSNTNTIASGNQNNNNDMTGTTVVQKPNNRRNAVRRLSSIFAKANTSIERTSRRVAARTLTGLITAMAEEVQDLTVEVDARDETPYRNKHITAVRIQFSRLGFKPLRLGGHNSLSDRIQQREAVTNHHSLLMDQFRFNRKNPVPSIPLNGSSTNRMNNRGKLMGLVTWNEDDYQSLDSDGNNLLSDHIDADEAFDRIDADKSGYLDKKELIQALGLAAIASNDKTLVLEDMESDSHVSILEELASDLFELYDMNGDGVVDRKEYKMMVADMAALRNRDRKRRREIEGLNTENTNMESHGSNWFTSSIGFIQNKTVSAFVSSIELFQSKTKYLPSVEYITNQSGIITSGVTTGLKFVQNNTGFLTTGVEFVQNKTGFIYTGVEYVQNTTGLLASNSIDFIQNNTSFTEYVQNNTELLTNGVEFVKGKLPWQPEQKNASSIHVLDNPENIESITKSLGSITFSDVKMDLRRLFFGAVPILKSIVPGGPLILEPFTTTITGSFNRNDILNSVLLDAGLRRLVMRALRRRVGFARDVLDGAIFKGRSWKTFGDVTGGGPRVEIPELTNVEFDANDKLIITGRARVQPSPDAAVINQSFKVRTSIGTRKDGRFIRLEEPELALVLECPESWDESIGRVCDLLTIEKPQRPSPLYTFFPIYSPFKLQDDDGFDLGEDNCITSLYIKDGALRFEMSAVLRPGRFLGSHYIAFSIPIRTFIVTLDRLKEGIRSARKVKKAAQRALISSDRKSQKQNSLFARISLDRAGDAILGLNDDRVKQNVATSNKKIKMKSFFSRFIDGYLQAERDEAKKERLTSAIQDFFGRQGI